MAQQFQDGKKLTVRGKKLLQKFVSRKCVSVEELSWYLFETIRDAKTRNGWRDLLLTVDNFPAAQLRLRWHRRRRNQKIKTPTNLTPWALGDQSVRDYTNFQQRKRDKMLPKSSAIQ